MNIFFDMDGVLLDSQEHIVAAYAEAGVVAPPDILAWEGRDWLHTDAYRLREIKRRKDAAYARFILGYRVLRLPGWEAAVKLKQLGHRVHLLTGAAWSAVDALYRTSEVWPFGIATAKLTSQAKRDIILSFNEHSVFVDDQPHAFNGHWGLVHEDPDVHVIRYEGWSSEQLMEAICSCA